MLQSAGSSALWLTSLTLLVGVGNCSIAHTASAALLQWALFTIISGDVLVNVIRSSARVFAWPVAVCSGLAVICIRLLSICNHDQRANLEVPLSSGW